MPFRLVPQLDRSPRVVAFARTPPGKMAVLLCFGFFLFLLRPSQWAPLTGALFFFSFWPRQRRAILLAATLLFLALGYNDFRWSESSVPYLRNAGIPDRFLTTQGAILGMVLVLLFCALWVHVVGRSRLAPRITRPVALLITFYFLLALALSYVPAPPGVKALLWVFAFVFGKFFWFLCYSLRECRSSSPPDFIDEVGHYLPFWRPLHVPIPKGSQYLAAIEAKTPQELAVVQLKGLKLIMWAFVLMVASFVFNGVLCGGDALSTGFGTWELQRGSGLLSLGFEGRSLLSLQFLPADLVAPRYDHAFQLSYTGNPLPFYSNWAALLVFYVVQVISLTVEFHVVVAICRMCGYNAFRNTYKPLSSMSIAEFWNRLYYYFKELLVYFFFYPVFFRYFKNHPRLRLYCATLAAACFGNCIYHLFRDFGFIIERGLFRAIADFHTYILYSFVLATSIFISQLRLEKRGRRKHGAVAKVLSPAWVFVFYSVLSIFADYRREGVWQNFAFFFSLFNLSPR